MFQATPPIGTPPEPLKFTARMTYRRAAGSYTARRRTARLATSREYDSVKLVRRRLWVMKSEYERERAEDFLESLDRLWVATDYPECQEIALYTDQELKQILGEWEQVRKACDAIWARIRDARPDLQGWDPISGERPLGQ